MSKNQALLSVAFRAFSTSLGLHLDSTGNKLIELTRYTVRVNVQDVSKTIEHLSRSVSILKDHLQDGHSLYGKEP